MKRPESLQLHGKVELGKSEKAAGPRPFSMLAYSGAVVERGWGKAVFDLAGMSVPLPLPMLLNHDGNKICGTATEAEVTEEGLQLRGVITDKTEHGRLVIDLGRDDPDDPPFPWTASVGLQGIKWEELDADQVADVNGQQLEGPLSVGRLSSCYETSFISAGPADANTHAAVLRGEESTQQSEEGPMTPEEFASANPAAVEAWKAQGKLAAVGTLSTLLAMFPGAAEQVVDAFTQAQGEELPAQAAMAGALFQRLQSQQEQQQLAQAAPAAAPAAPAKAQQLAHAPQVEQLAAKARVAPGLGFSGHAREHLTAEPVDAVELSALPIDERIKLEWERSPRERLEFNGRFPAFAAMRRREIQREGA